MLLLHLEMLAKLVLQSLPRPSLGNLPHVILFSWQVVIGVIQALSSFSSTTPLLIPPKQCI